MTSGRLPGISTLPKMEGCESIYSAAIGRTKWDGSPRVPSISLHTMAAQAGVTFPAGGTALCTPSTICHNHPLNSCHHLPLPLPWKSGPQEGNIGKRSRAGSFIQFSGGCRKVAFINFISTPSQWFKVSCLTWWNQSSREKSPGSKSSPGSTDPQYYQVKGEGGVYMAISSPKLVQAWICIRGTTYCTGSPTSRN